MNLYCVLCESKLIPVSRTETKCDGGCHYNGNIKQLKDLNLVCVFIDDLKKFMSWDRFQTYKTL